MTICSHPRSTDAATLRIEGPLYAPIDGQLRAAVLAALRKGTRKVVLDLAGVSKIDAAGIGELVRVYSLTIALNGVLQVVHVTARVREALERVGVFGLLTSRAPGDGAGLSDDPACGFATRQELTVLYSDRELGVSPALHQA